MPMSLRECATCGADARRKDLRRAPVYECLGYQLKLTPLLAPPPLLPPPAAPKKAGSFFFPESAAAHAPNSSDAASTKTRETFRRTGLSAYRRLQSVTNFVERSLTSIRLISLKTSTPERVRAKSNDQNPAKLDRQTFPELRAVHLVHKNRNGEINLIRKRQELQNYLHRRR